MSEHEVGKLYPIAKAILTPTFRAAWRFTLEGAHNVPSVGGAILCPNHTSVLDSFFVPALLPRRVTYVGKAEYMDDWKTRKLFPALGMIPIDREGGDAGERALATAQRIIESGQLFGIYPEGTRSRDGRLYRGHTGPARLALRTGAPIIPIGITGAREVMPPDAKFPTLRLPVTIRFGKPIDVTRYMDRQDDRLLLRQIIDEVMYEIRELSGQEYVDEYANKKRATAEATATSATTSSEAIAPSGAVSTENSTANGSVDASRNGALNGGSHMDTRADLYEDDNTLIPGEGLFVRATEQRSSTDVLKRPVRRVPT
ncbi:MAG: 1-acyl-sn-glycerol-3-phosphate acyltransferase [Acidimicrobiales bacterium]|nr:1-acyl-sn-glycerol-3-phosphate acyltransferase [Acidimicrobiales bacterium]